MITGFEIWPRYNPKEETDIPDNVGFLRGIIIFCVSIILVVCIFCTYCTVKDYITYKVTQVKAQCVENCVGQIVKIWRP